MKILPGMQRGGLSPHTLEFLHSRDCRALLANGDRGVVLVSYIYISIHLPQPLLFNLVLMVTFVFTISYLGKSDSYTFITSFVGWLPDKICYNDDKKVFLK